MEKASYEKMVKTLRKGVKGVPSSKIFPNKGAEHANIVLSNIFDSASTNINMLTGSMNDEVLLTEDFKNSLSNFLEKSNTRLRIVFLDAFDNNSQLLKLISHKENVELYKPSHSIRFNDKIYHFTTADGRMLRLENDVKKFSAFCSFNAKNDVKELDKVFEEIISESERINL